MKNIIYFCALVAISGCRSAPTMTKPPTPPKILFRPINAAKAEAVSMTQTTHHKTLPALQYPTNTPAVWTLQYSDDLIHWHNLASYGTTPMQEQMTAPPHGTRFFRRIGSPFKPEGTYKHLPGKDD